MGLILFALRALSGSVKIRLAVILVGATAFCWALMAGLQWIAPLPDDPQSLIARIDRSIHA